MSLLGRPPKPTRLKLLQGNPGKRQLPKAEPRPEAKAPRPPKWLKGAALSEWRRIVPELERLGLMTRIDRAALTGYCASWARFREAEEFLTKNGTTYVVRDKDGRTKAVVNFPQVGTSRAERLVMHRFLVGFGLDPSSRSRVKSNEVRPRSALEELLGRGAAGRRGKRDE